MKIHVLIVFVLSSLTMFSCQNSSNFSAESLEVGRYLLLCGGETGLLHTDLEFEVVEADPTGIDKPATADDQKAQWYDMQGRRMPQKPTTPGIYIRNGKKVIVK